MNIFLIGYRGSGKTVVGSTLAVELERAFIDADDRLVVAEGKTISKIVATRGWGYFRQRETAVIKTLCDLDRHVIATGGGVVLNPANVTAMKRSGKLIWLQAAPETIRQRILQDSFTGNQRPALTTGGVLEEIEATLSERRAFYEAAMDFSVHTDGRSVDDVCKLIINWLDRRW